MKETLAIASDHAGYEMKLSLIAYLKAKGYGISDLGTNSSAAVNYPDFGHPLAEADRLDAPPAHELLPGTLLLSRHFLPPCPSYISK